MSTILIENPTWLKKEEWLQFRGEAPADEGRDVVVVSGYANYSEANIIGSSDSDLLFIPYEMMLWVGPRWRELNDVSPTAFISGFRHYSSDEADMTGMEINECRWEFPDPNPTQDHGSMYGRSFEDPDGHIWEVMWMDLAAHLAAAGEPVPELA